MTHTVEDCVVMFEVIAGHDPFDEHSAQVPLADYRAELVRPVRGLRVGLIRDYSLTHVQKAVGDAVRAALKTLEGLGAQVEEIAMPSIHGNISAQLTIESCEPSAYHQQWLRTRAADYGDDVRTLLESGEMYLAMHYIQAQRYRSLDVSGHALHPGPAVSEPAAEGVPRGVQAGRRLRHADPPIYCHTLRRHRGRDRGEPQRGHAVGHHAVHRGAESRGPARSVASSGLRPRWPARRHAGDRTALRRGAPVPGRSRLSAGHQLAHEVAATLASSLNSSCVGDHELENEVRGENRRLRSRIGQRISQPRPPQVRRHGGFRMY